jgi:ubiquinone/menaquinone biosynthesis C-methylase UbiE
VNSYHDEIWASVPLDRPIDAAAAQWAIEFALAAKGEPLLDLGCGDGKLAAAMVKVGAEVTGVDPSTVAIERAREAAPAARFVQLGGDGKLPLEDSSFAAAVSVNVLEHVADTQTFMSELRRVLAPDATVAIAVPSNGWLQTLLAGPGGFSRRHDPLEPVLRFYTPRTLRDLLEQFDFDAIAVRRSGRTLLATAKRA